MSDFKRHDTVWYYLEKEKSWRRGKIRHVNKYWLQIKDVPRDKIYYIRVGLWVVDAAFAKPTHVPKAWYEVAEQKRSWLYFIRSESSRIRLYKKLGVNIYN